jgi:hypothetical protein
MSTSMSRFRALNTGYVLQHMCSIRPTSDFIDNNLMDESVFAVILTLLFLFKVFALKGDREIDLECELYVQSYQQFPSYKAHNEVYDYCQKSYVYARLMVADDVNVYFD